MQLTKELAERILKTAPAQFGHHLQSGYMHPRVQAVSSAFKVLGHAYTVRITERDGSALYYAIMKAPKGAVIVVDRGGEENFACAGDQLVLMMKHRELGGLIVDGPVTDRIGLERLGFPVFCTGFSPVTTLCTGTNGEVQIPIQCGGAVVNPGDVVFGDADGVVVLPENFEHLLTIAEKMTQGELTRAQKVENEGYRFLQREDFDVTAFFELDKEQIFKEIKAGCKYD